MRSETIFQDTMNFARESFSVLLFAILLLVTGCGSSASYSPRTDLAPPPPFMTADNSFGPPVPVEIALRLAVLENIQDIEPAAGEDVSEMPAEASTGCHVKTTGFSQQESRISFGSEPMHANDSELSFARLHSGRDSAEMTVRFSFSLPAATRSGCR